MSSYSKENSQQGDMGKHRLVSVKEYASEKGVSVQYVYQQIKAGKIDVKRVGGMIIIQVE